MKVKDFYLEDGNAQYVCRTITTETGLDPETEVDYIGNEVRDAGKGHYDCLYRVRGTNDLLRIRHKFGQPNNPDWEGVYLEPDYFKV